MIITIDGPSASGKSTVGRELAKQLHFYYVYSGLLYRALAYLLINKRAYKHEQLKSPTQEDITQLLDPKKFVYRYDDQERERIFFENQDITPFLKDSFIDQAASIVSTNEHVRSALRGVQHLIARSYDLVVDGRDAGSIVFPQAEYKFFLTASPEVRAERWRLQQLKLGEQFSEQEARIRIGERDKRDKTRDIAPLIIPQDAIVVDNSSLTIKETVDKMLELLRTNAQLARLLNK
jgi:cytidylate kinase